MVGRGVFGDDFEDQFGDPGADLVAALVNAGERDADGVVVVQIAAADDGDLIGDTSAELGGRGLYADGDDVVEAEDAVGAMRQVPELGEGGCAVTCAIDVGAACGDEVLGREGAAMLLQGVCEALVAAVACAVLRAADVGDAFAADGKEVLGGELAGGVVVGTDEVRGEAGEGAVDEDERGFSGLGLREHGGVGLAGGDDECVEPVREDVLDLLLLQSGVFFGGRENEEVAVLAQGDGEAAGDVGEEGMQEVRHDEADERGAPGDERACGEVGAVVQLLHLRFDAFTGFAANVRVSAQRL